MAPRNTISDSPLGNSAQPNFAGNVKRTGSAVDAHVVCLDWCLWDGEAYLQNKTFLCRDHEAQMTRPGVGHRLRSDVDDLARLY